MNSVQPTWDILRMLASMALVLGLLGALLWGLRKLQARLQPDTGSDRPIKIIHTLSLGPRHKITLIEVDHRRVLLGMSGQQMQALADWPSSDTSPIDTVESEGQRA